MLSIPPAAKNWYSDHDAERRGSAAAAAPKSGFGVVVTEREVVGLYNSWFGNACCGAPADAVLAPPIHKLPESRNSLAGKFTYKSNEIRTGSDKGREGSGLPTIAIVGRPNVGKSTLFNRLVGRRRALVGDEPGITRDRIYGTANWLGRSVRVVDTGGIVPEDKQLIPSEIFRQAKVALEEAFAIGLPDAD